MSKPFLISIVFNYMVKKLAELYFRLVNGNIKKLLVKMVVKSRFQFYRLN